MLHGTAKKKSPKACMRGGREGNQGGGGKKAWVPLCTPPQAPTLHLWPSQSSVHHPHEQPPSSPPHLPPPPQGTPFHTSFGVLKPMGFILKGVQAFLRHKSHPSTITALGVEKPSSLSTQACPPVPPGWSHPLCTHTDPCLPAGPTTSPALSPLPQILPSPQVSSTGSYLISFISQNEPFEGREARGCF